MPETTAPAAPATPAPAAPAEPVAATPAKSVADTVPPATPPATGEAASSPPPPKDNNVAMLAQAKRLSAKAQQQMANAKAILDQAAAFKTKAERYDYLEKLQQTDPIKFMEDTGMDFTAISKLWLAKSTGQGKTPQQLVDEAVSKRMAEDNAKREEERRHNEAIERQRRDKQTFEGTRAEFARIAKADPVKYEVASRMPPGKVSDDAFTIMKDHFGRTKEVISFSDAVAGAEYHYKQEQLAILGIEVKDGTPTEQLNATWAKMREMVKKQQDAEAAAAAKAKPPAAAATRGTEQRPVVETQGQSSPTSTPKPRSRRIQPLNYRKIADELAAGLKSRSDN